MNRQKVRLSPSRTRTVRQRSAILARCGAVLACSLVLTSCDDPTPVEPARAATPTVVVTPGGQPTSVRPEEQPFSELSRGARSAAGFYMDSGGAFVVLVRDEADDARAQTAFYSLLNAGTVRARRRTPSVRVRRARFTFGQLAVWRDLLSDPLLDSRGVLSLDLDEVRNTVTVGVRAGDSLQTQSAVRALASSLGVDSAALAFRTHEPLQLSSGPAASSAALVPAFLTQQFDTLVGGIRIITSQAWNGTVNAGCTLGPIVDRNGVRGFITPTHCTRVWGGGPDGTVMSQLAGRQIGVETVDPNKSSCGSVFTTNWCRNSDAAYFATSSGIQSHRGLIARTKNANNGYYNGGNGSSEIDPARPYFIVNGTAGAYVGQRVEKMGASSGWTWGVVNETCVDHKLELSWNSYYVTKCTIGSNIHHLDGDSGGPLFFWEGGDDVQLLGTHFGATNTQNGVASYWQRIAADIGGTVNATRGINLATPTNVTGTTNASQLAVISWSPVAGATRYHLYAQYWYVSGYNEWGYPVYDNRTEYLGSTSQTSVTDPDQYRLVHQNGCPFEEEVTYWVKAASNTDISGQSSLVWFCRL